MTKLIAAFRYFANPPKKKAKTEKQTFILGNLLLIKLRTFPCLEEEQTLCISYVKVTESGQRGVETHYYYYYYYYYYY